MSGPSSRQLKTERVLAFARELGFDAAGIADASAPLEEEYDRYEAFLEQGFEGSMQWLRRDREVRRRLDGEGMLLGAKSVICLARSYKRDDSGDRGTAKHLARYARGRDYHTVVRRKLRQLAAFVRKLEPEASARPIADDAPILERAWAARAGLGFIGKNGLLIVPGQGSYVLLGEVLTNVELDVATKMSERCGSCVRCIQACPTEALVAPFVLDARRCLAYWTIEQRGAIDGAIAERAGEWLFGCDVCQEICPFNASKSSSGERTASFEPHARWAELRVVDWLDPKRVGDPELLRGTPLARVGAEGMARNAAMVLGNQATLAPDELHALRTAAAHDERSAVREQAQLALQRREKPPREGSG